MTVLTYLISLHILLNRHTLDLNKGHSWALTTHESHAMSHTLNINICTFVEKSKGSSDCTSFGYTAIGSERDSYQNLWISPEHFFGEFASEDAFRSHLDETYLIENLTGQSDTPVVITGFDPDLYKVEPAVSVPANHFIGNGDKAFLIAGRTPGTDDDTVHLVLANSELLASATFVCTLLGGEISSEGALLHVTDVFEDKCDPLVIITTRTELS